jgi:hypothetical protein
MGRFSNRDDLGGVGRQVHGRLNITAKSAATLKGGRARKVIVREPLVRGKLFKEVSRRYELWARYVHKELIVQEESAA